MDRTAPAPLALAAGGLLLLGGVPGWCGEPQGRLDLAVEPSDSAPALGEEFDLTLRLLNSGQAPLVLYHPESIHKVSDCWSLSCRVTRPGGNELVLEPEITFASAPLEKRDHFRELAVGDAVTVEIHIRADDPSATHTPSGWVGLIPISETESELLPEKAIKALYRIRGEIYFISGGGQWLAIRDLLGDVFNRPGEYRLEFEYENRCTHAWELPEDGTTVWTVIEQAWSGDLSATLVITIEE